MLGGCSAKAGEDFLRSRGRTSLALLIAVGRISQDSFKMITDNFLAYDTLEVAQIDKLLDCRYCWPILSLFHGQLFTSSGSLQVPKLDDGIAKVLNR